MIISDATATQANVQVFKSVFRMKKARHATCNDIPTHYRLTTSGLGASAVGKSTMIVVMTDLTGCREYQANMTQGRPDLTMW